VYCFWPIPYRSTCSGSPRAFGSFSSVSLSIVAPNLPCPRPAGRVPTPNLVHMWPHLALSGLFVLTASNPSASRQAQLKPVRHFPDVKFAVEAAATDDDEGSDDQRQLLRFRLGDQVVKELPWGACNIDRRQSLQPEEFERVYRHRRPVLVSGEGTNQHLSLEQVVDAHGEEMVTVGHPQGTSLPPVEHQISRFDAQNVQVRRLGVRRLPLGRYMRRPFTEQDPLFLFTYNLSLLGAENKVQPTRWAPALDGAPTVSMGRQGSGLPLHWHDEAVLELIEGHKHWALFPPTTTPVADPARSHGQWMAGQPHQTEAPVLPAPVSCVQAPGETLYIPEGWWHATINIGDGSLAVGHQSVRGGAVSERHQPWFAAFRRAMQLTADRSEAGQAGLVANLSIATKLNPRNAQLQLALGLGHLQYAELLASSEARAARQMKAARHALEVGGRPFRLF
jgi:hypothetical protein